MSKGGIKIHARKTLTSCMIRSLSVQSPVQSHYSCWRVILRKDLGKKVWQRLSFLGSAQYKKRGASAHNVSQQNYYPPNPTCQFL